MGDSILARAAEPYNPPPLGHAKPAHGTGTAVRTVVERDSLSAEELSALESRAEIDSLGDLHQRRRQLMITLAPLKAEHGSFGLFDDRRKRFLESLKVRARTNLSAGRDKKPTEAEIDATAYADPAYEQFLDGAYDARIAFINQSTELAEIEERIRSRELAIMAYTGELRLAR